MGLAVRLGNGGSGSRVVRLVLGLRLDRWLRAGLLVATVRVLIAVGGGLLGLSRVGLGLLVVARSSLASLGDGDSLGVLVVDTGLVDRDGGVLDLSVLGVGGSGGLSNLVLAGGGDGDSDGLHNGGSNVLTIRVLAGLVRAVSAGLDTSLLEVGGVTTVGDGNASLGSGGGLRRLGDSVGNGHILGGLSVDTGLRVGLDISSRSLVDSGGLVLRPLAILVLLDLVGLLVVTGLAEAGAAVAGEAVSTEVLVRNLVDLLLHLVPGLGAVLLVIIAVATSGVGLTILATRSGSSGVVSDGGLGLVDGDGLLDVGDGDLLGVVVVDDSGDVLVLLPLFARLAIRASGAASGVGLVLRSNSHRLLAVTGSDGGVADLGAGGRLAGNRCRRSLVLITVALVGGGGSRVLDSRGAGADLVLGIAVVAVGVVGSRDTGEDECVTHVD